MKNKGLLLAIFLLFSIATFAQLKVVKVKPSDTDASISTFNSDSNYVYINTTVASQNILLVHLPGSYGEPKRATYFGSLAANLGFHSIGLMYPNIPTVGSLCANSTDSNCYENVRREIIEGIDYSSLIAINSSESILNRVTKLVIYLKANFPSENWGQYLDSNNNLIYSKIIFSGHSQGGGHAVLIAKYYPLQRALCFSAPKDFNNHFSAPPLWLSTGTWQTPKSKIYSFCHTLDEYTQQLVILDSLGIDDFGNPINVDANESPFGNTHQLITSYPVASGDEHASTVQDTKTPKSSGSPVFLTVWTYMLTHPLLASITESEHLYSFIYPNPTNDLIKLSLANDNYSIFILDQTGKKLISKQSSSGEIQIDLSNLNSGLYYVKIVDSKKSFNGKVMKH